MTSEEKPERKVDLTPHPLAPTSVKRLQGEEGQSLIIGFIGPSLSDERIRVYLDLSFDSFCEVAKDDVMQTARVDSQEETSPAIVWIRSSATVRLVSRGQLTADAAYVSGAIANECSQQAIQGAEARLEPVTALMEGCLGGGGGGGGVRTWFCGFPPPPPPPPPTRGWACATNVPRCPAPSRMFC